MISLYLTLNETLTIKRYRAYYCTCRTAAFLKAVKDITNLGLGESKELVDGAPKTILEKAKKEDAEAAKKTLEEAGATVELA